jgi:hypothetical protein
MSAINTPTTIAPDLTRGSARPTFGPQAGRRLAWIAGSIAGALLAGAGVVVWAAQSSPTSDGAPSVGAVSDSDLMAHGGAGHAVTAGGLQIGLVPELATDSDLMAHGGAGSVWTVSGTRLR